MIPLLRADVKARWRSIVGLSAGCLVFLLVLTATYAAYGGADAFSRTFGGKSPRLFTAFSGSANADVFSPQGFLAFGFGHPLFLLLTLALCISMGVASVAQDVESGRAELLYSAPIARSRILFARMVGLLLAESAVLVAGAIGGIVGSRVSPGMSGVSPLVVIRVLAQYLPLVLFVSAVGCAASARSSSRGGALGAAIGVTAGAYVLNLVALLWSPLGGLRHIDPFAYFRPVDAAVAIDWFDASVLLIATSVLIALAFRWLDRRDLI